MDAKEQDICDLLKACRWLVEAKRLKMADSAISHGIDQIAAVLRKIDTK